MDGWTLIDHALVMSGTTNFSSNITNDDWDNLSLSLAYCTNDAETADAETADVLLGLDTNTIHYNLPDTYTHPINQSFCNPNELFALEHTDIDTSPVDWGFMMLPTPIECPSSTTLTSPNITTEPSDYTSTYTTSSTSMAHSPTGPGTLQVSGNAPVQTADDKVASSTNTGRRTKMKPGTRPCDLK
jgi:hypothetical protein